MAAAVPWLIVIALLVLPGRFGGEEGANPTPTNDNESAVDDPGASADRPNDPAADVTPDDPADMQPEAQPPDVADLDLLELRGAWRVEPGDELAAVVGVAVARSWLTGMEPHLSIPGLDTPDVARYAEHLSVEAVERMSDDAAVVTVLAVVLEGEDALDASVHRLAVPIIWHDGAPRPAGPPWPLIAPDLERVPLPPGSELTDPDQQLAAVAALEAAGYSSVELVALQDSGFGPAIARIDARSPGGEPVTGDVWLRHHLDGFVVAGTTLVEP